MKPIEELRHTPCLVVKGRITEGAAAKYQIYHGWVDLLNGFRGTVVFGYDEAGLMEHVSVSSYKRRQLPTWTEMCRLKDMFFYPDEMVVQIHPTEDRYLHGVSMPGGRPLENVLHLWRPMNGDFSILNRPEEWD